MMAVELMGIRLERGDAYAGIGSRKTPAKASKVMRELAELFGEAGLVGRSGGAAAADEAFGEGAARVGAEFELYLPWSGFRGLKGERLSEPTVGGLRVASRFHPAWERCNSSARALHGRNSHQVLGADVGDPVGMVVCWTEDGSLDGSSRESGGTGQALRIAAGFEVPVVNLARREHMTAAKELLCG